MRLQLTVHRHLLPAVKTIWPVTTEKAHQQAYTIAKLLEDLNPIFPLESENWGLEDYVVEVNGHECLHFLPVAQALKDEDLVIVRPLHTSEVRARTLTGRYQISHGGQHLVDGIPFGRPHLRTATRPAITIPPPKRRRLLASKEHDIATALHTEGGDVETPGALTKGEDAADSLVDRDTAKQSRIAKRRKSVRFSQAPSSQALVLREMSGDESEDDDDFDPTDALGLSDNSSDEDSDENETSDEEDSDSEDSASVSSDVSSNGSSEASNSEESEELSSSSGSEESDASVGPDVLSSRMPVQMSRPYRQGTHKTHIRNARRRDKNKIRSLIRRGVLPSNAKMEDLRQWECENEPGKKKNIRRSNADTARVGSIARQQSAHELTFDNVEQASTTGRGSAQNVVATTPFNDQNDFNQRRAQLLQALESGGIDVTPEPKGRAAKRKAQASKETEQSSTINTEPVLMETHEPRESSKLESPDINGTTKRDDAEPAAETPAPKRPRFDLGPARRMIVTGIGSRGKIDKKPKTTQDVPSPASKDALAASEPANPDAWKEKINLSAFECWHEDVELSAPPFPFKQHWDPQANALFKKKSKKITEAKKKASRTNGTKLGLQIEEMAPTEDIDEEAPTLDYGEEDGSVKQTLDADDVIQEQLQQDAEIEVQVDDMPLLPKDLTSLPALTQDEVKIGAIIVFKHMTMSAETNWSPEILGPRTAQVESKDTGAGIRLRLARRDQPQQEKKYDPKGNRIYEKFDVQDDDEDEDGQVLMEPFGALMEARLLQAAPPDAPADDRKAVDGETVGDEMLTSA